jgi:hypothetical protein
MSVDATWNITMDTPMGKPQEATLMLAASGGGLSGSVAGPFGTTEIKDGHVDGNSLTWKLDVTVPMPMTLDFAGTVDGDKISGTMTSAYGSLPFSGNRA